MQPYVNPRDTQRLQERQPGRVQTYATSATDSGSWPSAGAQLRTKLSAATVATRPRLTTMEEVRENGYAHEKLYS